VVVEAASKKRLRGGTPRGFLWEFFFMFLGLHAELARLLK